MKTEQMNYMDKLIDLHTHTKCSDGSMTPAELVRHAKDSGLSAIAITDHDSTDGIAEAVREGEHVGIEVVKGIEFSAKSDTETHILGYFIDEGSEHIKSAIGYIRDIRRRRVEETCSLLQNQGISVSIDEVKEYAGSGILCRAHVARIMTDKGYTSSVSDAFDKWLSLGRPAYSDIQAISAYEAIEIIRKSGGEAYLAHLHLTKKSAEILDGFVRDLVDHGLSGIEGYYTEYTDEMQSTYQSLAAKYGLKISGGTDFHGKNKPHIKIGSGLGNLSIPYSVLENMRK